MVSIVKGAVVLLGVAALAGCAGYSELAYRQDHRLEFTSPRPYELVELPVTLSWTMNDFRIVEPGTRAPERSTGYFAIFVDTTPVKPGHTLRDITDSDYACDRADDCPDAQYLADRGVYTTTSTSMELDVVPELPSSETEQLHEATVVLLDSAGRRIGESAWRIPFKLRKKSIE